MAEKAEFSHLVVVLAAEALRSMGLVKDPETGKTVKNLESAQFAIDMLDILAEKTKGNLSKEEEGFLAATLAELKLKFVEVKKGEER